MRTANKRTAEARTWDAMAVATARPEVTDGPIDRSEWHHSLKDWVDCDCGKCGGSRPPYQYHIKDSYEVDDRVKWVCPKCGANNDSDQTFLTSCKICEAVCSG